MKKITFYDLFLIFAILCFWGNKTVYSSIILLCAGTLELINVIPKIAKELKHGK